MTVEKAERIYDSYSGVYDLLFKGVMQPGRERAVSALKPTPGHQILEVGVGTGLSLPYYPQGSQITGIDISAAMLKHAEIRARDLGMHRARFLRMGAEKMDLPDASFHKVVASYVLSTVSDPEAVLRELWRVCRPDGQIAILNHLRSPNRLLAAGERLLTPVTRRIGFVLDLSLEDLLKGNLFEVERVEKVNIPPLWSLVLLRRKGSPHPARGH